MTTDITPNMTANMTTKVTYSSEMLGVTAAGVFFISIVGTSGNLLAVVSFLRSATLKQNPSTLFMVNLSVCLLPVCAIGMLLFGVGCLQQQLYGEILFSEKLIEVLFAMGLILSQVHLHTICALAFNRLLAVMWPAWYKQLMQQRYVRRYLAVLWIYSALLWIPIACGAFGGLQYNPEELMAAMDTENSKELKGVHVFFTYMLPILFVSTCYITMYIKVRYSRSSKQIRESRKSVSIKSDDAQHQWDDDVTRTILVIFVFMVLCCVPHLVVHYRHLYARHPNAWLLLHLVFWLQFCLDPFVYVVVSAKYRAACAETAKKMMQCLGMTRLLEPSLTTSNPPMAVKFKPRLHPAGQESSQEVHV